MDYIIIGMLLILIILVSIALYKNIDETKIFDRLGRFENTMYKELHDFKDRLNYSTKEELERLKQNLNNDFDKLNYNIERRLILINEKVNERLEQGFEKTNKTFTDILSRLSKIDEAQKKIELLSTDIVSLQAVLTDKSARGAFGEVQLKHILSSVFGHEKNNIYKLQHTFNTNVRADAVLFAPEPLGTIAIDSKFPLENYRKMINRQASEYERLQAEKQFKNDVKKHINDISNKYIIDGVTTNQAIMFIPAEAIFAELNAHHIELVEYSHKNRVWMASPTTLMSTLSTIQIILKNIERDKYTNVIHEELNKLSVEFLRYKERWDKLSKNIEHVSKNVNEIHTTTRKITNRFESINKVDNEILEENKTLNNELINNK